MISLHISNLAKRYSSEFVFRDLNLKFEGKILGIAGANGSGKSTFLRTVSGLISSTAGSVEWSLEKKQYDPAEIATFLGYAAPYVQLYEELSAVENLRFIRDLRQNQRCEKIDTLLEEFEIEPFAESLYGKISSGQQQRVKLAAGVIHNPLILCLDEPGTNLDITGMDIIRRMQERCTKRGGIVLVASNQAAELEVCDKVFSLTK